MALVNCYATLDQLKGELGVQVSSTTHDTELELAISAASRHIDRMTGWRFWQDGTVVAREFYADDYQCCYVSDGISTTVGLIVKIDQDGDGTFETTLTVNTDFILRPLNALDDVPAWPYTELVAANNYSFPCLSNGRPGVQVTAKFGWPAVPDDITKACLVLAHDLYKSKDAPFGVAGVDNVGMLRVGTNRTVAALLSGYRKPSVG